MRRKTAWRSKISTPPGGHRSPPTLLQLLPKPQQPAPVVGVWAITELVTSLQHWLWNKQCAMLRWMGVRVVGENRRFHMIITPGCFSAGPWSLRCNLREFWHPSITTAVPVTREYGVFGSGACSVLKGHLEVENCDSCVKIRPNTSWQVCLDT